MTEQITTPPKIEVPAETVKRMDYYLRLTRALEERLVALFRQTKVIGGLYRSLGQEGESVATAMAGRRRRPRRSVPFAQCTSTFTGG